MNTGFALAMGVIAGLLTNMAAGITVAALVWMMLMLPLVYDSLLSGKVSIFVPLLGMLTLGELISVYRAVRDGGFRRR